MQISGRRGWIECIDEDRGIKKLFFFCRIPVTTVVLYSSDSSYICVLLAIILVLLFLYLFDFIF